MIKRVCSSCFSDHDLRERIRDIGGPRGCDACGTYHSPTSTITEVCKHIESCLRKYWGFAVDQLPYVTAEGGYQGATWDTYDLLLEQIGIDLPRDSGDQLLYALIHGITEEIWCDYDWGALDEDVALQTSWERFCETVKHERRFFFQAIGNSSRDSFSPEDLLKSIANISDNIGLIQEIPSGTKLWRARVDLPIHAKASASDYGPPPANLALQSNRMNPPGIPMLYLASTATTAIREARATRAHVGRWITERDLRVLDLRKLPDVPGIFSDATRFDRLSLRFLHHFKDDIMRPVARDNRTHIDYLPSQVVTEFIRDFDFGDGTLHGIAYGSTVSAGWNLSLFADPVDLGLRDKQPWDTKGPTWMKFDGAARKSASPK